MTVAVYAKEIATAWSSLTSPRQDWFSLPGAGTGDFGSLVAAMIEEIGQPSPNNIWSDTGYTAYTLDVNGDYDEVEVGRGILYDSTVAPGYVSPQGDTLTRSDANVSFSTNSNGVVYFAGGSTVYVALTLNAYQLLQGV